MTARTAVGIVAAALSVAVAACGSSSSGAAGTGQGGFSGTTGAGGAGGGAACQVNVLPVVPASFTDLAPGATVRVRGDVTGLPAASFSWVWQVTRADGAPVTVDRVGLDPALVEFSADAAGTYTISVELVGLTACGGRRTVVVANPDGKLASFRFRFTPPASGDPVQEREVQVVGRTPSGGNVIVLNEGLLVFLDTRDAASAQPAPAYVRLTDPAQRLTIEARRDGSDPARLRLAPGLFDVVVIPDGTLAPVLLAGKRPSDLANLGPLMLARGEPVTGTVSDVDGSGGRRPVAGARVVLRAGALPSTLATTGSDGRFTLRALPGTYGATVTRTMTTGLTMEAQLPQAAGVVVPSGGLASLDVDISAAATANLGISGLPQGARVLLRSDPIAYAVKVGVAVVSPQLRGELAPRADGTLAVAGLPRSRYSITVVPDPARPDAITSVGPVDLSAGDATAQVTMARKVPLSGRLLSDRGSAGISLVAVDMTGDSPGAVADVSDAQGRFMIAVSPARTYALRARPGPDRALAPAVFAPLVVTATGLDLLDRQMSDGLLYAGQVRDHFGTNGSPATLVQVFCVGAAPDCADPDVPVAETLTASDGTFALQLPDPGVR